jgi:hypothetical protein
MRLHIALVAFAVAFGAATVLAALTTVKHVSREVSSFSRPVSRNQG